MDYAGRMRLTHGVCDLRGIFQGIGEPEPFAADVLAQRLPGHVFHGNVGKSFEYRDVIDMDDVGMVKGRRGFGLLDEPSLAPGIGCSF